MEITITALQASTERQANDFAFSRLALQATRSILYTVLCIVAGIFTLHDRKQNPKLTHESEPLLTNGHVTEPTYGTHEESSSGSDDEEGYDDVDSDDDDDEPAHVKELKKKQSQRLKEAGNWMNYLKEYKIFIPMIWPYNNRFVKMCLAIIGAVLIAERFLNVLVPRQLGIITDFLTRNNGNGVFPSREVAVWMLLSYLNSRAGIYVVQQIAELPVSQYAHKNICASAFSHIMHLSMDFHTEKNSGELIRAIDQGERLHEMLDFILFSVAPIFIDLVIALVYVYTLFDIYMSLILVVVGAAYIWAGAKTTLWSIKRRRKFLAARRNQSKVQVEAIENWKHVSHFNRGQYESNRYGTVIDEFNRTEMSYFLTYYIGITSQSLIMVLGRLAASFLAIYRDSQGDNKIGDFIILNSYWRGIEGPLGRVSWSIRQVSQMLTDSERLLQLMKTTATVKNMAGAVDISIKDGHVEFEHVDFSYDGKRQILKDVSFVAKPGQTIALVGETGGGKSTILKLLVRIPTSKRLPSF